MKLAVVDAGGLIAAENKSPELSAVRKSKAIVEWIVPYSVVAQVWRGGSRQARLARFLKSCHIVGKGPDAGMRLGVLLGSTGTKDVVDATVVDTAREYRAEVIITSDPDDITRLVKAARLTVELYTV